MGGAFNDNLECTLERKLGKTKYSIGMLMRLAYNGIFNFSDLPIKFITRLGLISMLVAIIYLMFLTQENLGMMSASLLDFYKLQIPFIGSQFFSLQTLLFFAFALAFAIKVPVFPFHTWLPDAHVEAPTPGSVILAGVMLKMGTYGFIRWTIPLFPDAKFLANSGTTFITKTPTTKTATTS